LDKKFNEDSKNVVKTVTFSLQVGSTGDFVPDCQTVLRSAINEGSEKVSCSIRYKTLGEIYDSYFNSGHVTA